MLVMTYICVCGGGLTRDCVAIALGVDTPLGNFAPGLVVPFLLSGLLYHRLILADKSPLLQLGLGLPACFLSFYVLPGMLHTHDMCVYAAAWLLLVGIQVSS